VNALQNSTSISNKDKVKELLQLDQRINHCPSVDSATYAIFLRKLGVAYFNATDYSRAVQYTLKSEQILRKVTERSSANVQDLSDCYFNLQIYYDSLGEVLLQGEAMDSCLAIDSRINSDYYNSCFSIGSKIRHLFNKGDYFLCLKYCTLGETLIQQHYHYRDSFDILFYIQTYKVDALVLLKDFINAERILLHKVSDCQPPARRKYLGTVYGLLGLEHKLKGDRDKSIYYFKECYKYNIAVGYNKGCAEALNNIGDQYLQLPLQLNEALAYSKKALKYSDQTDSIFAFNNIANVHVQKGSFDSAFAFFQRAFDCIAMGMTIKDLVHGKLGQDISNKTTEYLTRVILDLGDAFLQQYKSSQRHDALSHAYSIYREADQLLGRIRSEQLEFESKLFWRSHLSRLYEHAIEVSFLNKDTAGAFYFFEKSRAVLLSDQLNERQLLTEKEITSQTELRKRILALENELNVLDKSSARYYEAQKDLLKKEQELEHLINLRKDNRPVYWNLHDTVSTVAEIRRNLLKDFGGLIEIFSGKTAAYILAIGQKQMYLSKIDLRAFDSLSALYESYISHPDLLNSRFDSFISVSHALYSLIFQGIDLPGGRIIISPNGKYFPFEALVTSVRPLTYFVDNHAISYTYSARYLLNTFNSSVSEHSPTFLGIAPVKFVKRPELTGSDLSLKKIRGYFNQVVNYFGTDASKGKFLNEFYKYKIIQLYTHGTDSGYGAEPMIYFSDSALSLSDLLPDQKPATHLIVLSACETASGRVYSGEGVFSFNRGFAALGIPSCVSNLWQVGNKATYRLTELFYKYLAKGLPLDVALQKAKQEFRETAKVGEEKLPYYWAAPILVGKTDPIPLQAKARWGLIAGVAFLASILVSGWLIRKRKVLRNRR